MATENLDLLKQLVETIEKAELKLEKSYKKERVDEFNKIKKLILDNQEKISGLIKG